jgi:hypothetical protein
LYAIPCIVFIFQVFHANAKQQHGIALQQDAQPVVILFCIKPFKQCIVRYVLIAVLVQSVSFFFLDAPAVKLHKERVLFIAGASSRGG